MREGVDEGWMGERESGMEWMKVEWESESGREGWSG